MVSLALHFHWMQDKTAICEQKCKVVIYDMDIPGLLLHAL